MREKTTLILGGTGKTGRRIAQRLSTQGLRVRVASRSGTPPFDWNDPKTWEPRSAASTPCTSPTPRTSPSPAPPSTSTTWLAKPRAPEPSASSSSRAVASLRSSRPRRPSARAARPSPSSAAPSSARTSAKASSSPPSRPASSPFPAGTVQEPFIDTDDIADVAIAALTSDAHAGKIYELTGPRLMTFAEAVLEIAAAAARPVRYRAISPEEFAADLSHVMPPEEATFLAELFRQILDGHNAHLDHHVERILNRKPRDFRDFARQAAAAGAWRG
jgi:uncharacterized protein YbjT (DUF2867 family)